MGWSKQKVDADGKRIVKVLAMATNDASLMPSDMWFSRPFKGTGGDTCSNNRPNPELVGKLLRDNDVSFLGLISGEKIVKDIWSGWHQWSSEELEKIRTR